MILDLSKIISLTTMSVRGFEPRTTWLKVKCSTTWATHPYIIIKNWASWTRTSECSSQSAVPYRLAIAQEIKKGWVQGFEPWTFRATIWRADQLCYTHHNAKVISYWPWLIKKSVPGGIRTLDPRLRRPLLYPTELQTHESGWWESNPRI